MVEEPRIRLTVAMVRARLGSPGSVPAEWEGELASAVSNALDLAEPRIEYARLPVDLVDDRGVEMEGRRFQSADLAARLRGCSRCTVFLATIGPAIDRAIERLAGAPSRQVVLDAAGSEAAEACARWLQRAESASARSSGFRTVHRFSPGYGDLSLDHQSWFVQNLSGVGVTLSPGGMMIPRKSITGMIGWKTC